MDPYCDKTNFCDVCTNLWKVVYIVKLSIQMFSRICYSDSARPKYVVMTAYSENTNNRNACTILWKVGPQNFRDKSSQKRVIWIPQGLNRLIWPLITIKQSLVMFVQFGEKLYRKSFDTNDRNDLLFWLHKA